MAPEELEPRCILSVALSIADARPVFEGGGREVVFVVSRTGDPGPVRVSYTTRDGSAVAGTDYLAQSGTVTFAANQASATIRVPVLNAASFQGQRTFTVALSDNLPNIGFSPRQTFSVGSGPVFTIVKDLNADGKPDLAVADLNDATVSVLLNTGTQAGAADFTDQQTFDVGRLPESIAIEDFNGDGKPDLAVANFNDGTVSMLLNTTPAGATTPSFAAQQTFAVGMLPQSLVAADLNGDGKPDLAVANYGGGTVSVLLNTTETGATSVTFDTQQTFAAGERPAVVGTADFNGDGKPDLVAGNYNDRTLSVLLNTTPDGATDFTFTSPQTFPVGTRPLSVGVKDLNGDGKPDLVCVNEGAGTVSVLLNTTAHGAAAPTFTPQQLFIIGKDPLSVAVEDVNGDGKPDLAVANRGGGTVSVLLNTTPQGAGQASLTDAMNFATGSFPESVAVEDVNGDGKPDLAVANYGDGTVSVLLNAPSDITFTRNEAVGTLLSTPPAGLTATVTLLNVTPPASGMAWTLTVRVTGGSGPAAGRVLFFDRFRGRARLLGMAELDAGGIARLTRSRPAGRHHFFAIYLGDTSHAGSTSVSKSVAVRTARH